MSSGNNLAVTTSTTGTNYVAFADQPLLQLTLFNDTGVTIQWQQVGNSVDMPLLDGTAVTIFGITNANQIRAKRKDNANTQVTVPARWES